MHRCIPQPFTSFYFTEQMCGKQRVNNTRTSRCNLFNAIAASWFALNAQKPQRDTNLCICGGSQSDSGVLRAQNHESHIHYDPQSGKNVESMN